MEKSSRRYMVTNTTIKEPRLGPNGKDARKIQERNGYVVQFRDEIGNVRMVTPKKWGGNPVMVTNLTEGLYDLYHKGLVDIEEIADISQALKRHTLEKRKESAPEEPKPEEPKPEKKRATAVEMGKGLSEREKVTSYGNAINPDGPDNFTVTAPRGGKKKKEQEV